MQQKYEEDEITHKISWFIYECMQHQNVHQIEKLNIKKSSTVVQCCICRKISKKIKLNKI